MSIDPLSFGVFSWCPEFTVPGSIERLANTAELYRLRVESHLKAGVVLLRCAALVHFFVYDTACENAILKYRVTGNE
jgi:hypothetical protein